MKQIHFKLYESIDTNDDHLHGEDMMICYKLLL